MEGAEQDQKTEDATSKRLTEARDEGNIPISRELSSWFVILSVWASLSWFLPHFAVSLKESLRVFLEIPHQISLEDGGFRNVFIEILGHTGWAVTLVFGFFLVMTVLGTMLQTGFYTGSARLKLDFERLSPMRGMAQLFSMNSVSELIKSFFKLVVLGYLTYRVLVPVFEHLPGMGELSLMSSMAYLHDEAAHLLLVLLFVISVIAVADVLYVRYQYFKGLRMTKQEVKDEYKQTEGDPMVKSRLRQIRIEKARRRMMAKVPTASVVITNPTHFAVALHYEGKKMAAPVLVAKGVDNVAFRIRDVAEANEVPIVSNPPLARALYDTVDLDQPISPEHYRAVAEVISYVYKIKNKKR